MECSTFRVTLARREGYELIVRYGPGPGEALVVDEPPPVGRAAGPGPAALLGAAVASCLTASLLYCLEKSRVPVTALSAEVEGTVERNERGRLRVSRLRVRLAPEVAAADVARLRRCAALFEEFCTVTESVRQGIPVDVAVELGEPETAPALSPG